MAATTPASTLDDVLSFLCGLEESWVIAGFLFAYLTYYVTSVVKKPMLVCSNPKLRELITDHIPILNDLYWPTIWCFEGRLHTLVKGILDLKTSKTINYRRELITTPDGGEICLDWVDDDTEQTKYSNDDWPTVILMPGISGSSAEGYAMHMVQDVKDLGYRPVVFNNRGMGGSSLRTPRTFCVHNTDDLRTVVCHLKKLHPRAPVMAAGASAGGINLFHYVCNYGADCKLSGVMIVSVLYDMFKSTKSLESFPNIVLFNNTLTSGMVDRIVEQNLPMLEQNPNLDLKHIRKARTIRQFHTRLTIPMFGYSDWQEYYRKVNLVGRMDQIKVPTMFLSAADDPLAPLSSIPVEEIKQQENVILVVTSYGGHAGFMRGLNPSGPTLCNKVFSQFVDAIFTHME